MICRVQKVTAAASSESEFVTLSEMVKKQFLRHVKEFMAPPMDKHIEVYEDNKIAIKMAKNR